MNHKNVIRRVHWETEFEKMSREREGAEKRPSETKMRLIRRIDC